jgi:hypothetical protein
MIPLKFSQCNDIVQYDGQYFFAIKKCDPVQQNVSQFRTILKPFLGNDRHVITVFVETKFQKNRILISANRLIGPSKT